MVEQVDIDARGIVTPDAGLTRFDLDRFPATPKTARFIDRYWLATWDLRGQPSHTQHVFAHPVVNIGFVNGGSGVVNGVSTGTSSRTLEGKGWALGIMFRPAGFRPLLGRPMSTITDTLLPFTDVIGPAADGLAAALADAAPHGPTMAAIADDLMASLLPDEEQPSETTSALVERIAADPAFLRVDGLAAETGATVRQLQRRFAEHVGIGPKAVIQRYRLFEAAERARAGTPVDWAAVAADLGFSDQAHLTREFTANFGMPPGQYLHANRGER